MLRKSIHVEDFFHVGPPGALGAVREGLLAGFADGPPFLGAGVGGHGGHIGGEVGADILEVAKEVVLTVGQTTKEDRVVADVRALNLRQNIGPDGGVEAFVSLDLVLPQTNHTSVTFHRVKRLPRRRRVSTLFSQWR